MEIPVFNASTVDPEHSAASDLALYCLPMSLLWDARLKWVNIGLVWKGIYVLILTWVMAFDKG